MKRGMWAVAAAVALSLVAGCTSTGGSPDGKASSGSSTALSSGGSLAFRPCPDEGKRVLRKVPNGVEISCGKLTVPLSWQHRGDGRHVQLAVVRVRRDAQHNRIGSLLINPGGPGASAIDEALSFAVRAPALTKRFDIVGFDPRGVGESGPLRCISPAEKDRSVALTPDPSNPAQFTAQVRLAEEVANGCYDKYGSRLRYFSTVETARDMDAVRAALGDSKLTYLGFSYGTLLGAVYATIFPNRVRALALDGAVDPAADEVALAMGQAAGFEHAFGQFADWCAQNEDQCPVGSDARDVVEQLLGRAKEHPIPSSSPGETRKATDGNVLLAVVQALYVRSWWPLLGRALELASSGDSLGVLFLDDLYTQRQPSGRFSNLLDANVVINCADQVQRAGVGEIRKLDSSWSRKYPLFGSSVALGMLTCAKWKVAADPPPTVSAPSAAPIVVVGSPNDPATPYAWAAALSRQLRSAVLLTADGEGHTSYMDNTCVRHQVDEYLVSRTVPKKGTVCPAG